MKLANLFYLIKGNLTSMTQALMRILALFFTLFATRPLRPKAIMTIRWGRAMSSVFRFFRILTSPRKLECRRQA